MATKEMFIKDRSYQFEQSVPNLVDMNISKVSPYKENDVASTLGSVITKYADTATKINQAGEASRLKTELSSLENEFKIKYLANPNAFNTEEGRQQIATAYNDVIGKKKALLGESKVKMTAEQYADVNGFFKQQTSNTVFNTQKDINQSFVKETVDNITLGSEMTMNALLQEDDELLRDNMMSDMLKDMGNLKMLGIDPTKMQLDYVVTAQQKITEQEVKKNIVDNFTNPRYFQRDSAGNVQYADPPYNTVPLIDVFAKQRDLMDLQNGYLSDDAVRQSAKEVAKQIGINEEDAFNIIRNNREGEWMKSASRMSAEIRNQYTANEAKFMRYEEQKFQNRMKEQLEFQNSDQVTQAQRLARYNGSSVDVYNTVDPSTGATLISTLTEGRIPDVQTGLQQGFKPSNMIKPAEAKNVAISIMNINTEEDAQSLARTLKASYGDENRYTPEMELAVYTDVAGEITSPSVTPKLIQNVANGDAQATKRLLSYKQMANYTLPYGYNNNKGELFTGNAQVDKQVMQNLLNNQEDFVSIPKGYSTPDQQIEYIYQKARSDKKLMTKIKDLQSTIKTETNKVPFVNVSSNTNSGSPAMNIYTREIDTSYDKINVNKLYDKKNTQAQNEAAQRIQDNASQNNTDRFIDTGAGQKQATHKLIKEGKIKIQDFNTQSSQSSDIINSFKATLSPTTLTGQPNPTYDKQAYDMLKQQYINGYRNGTYDVTDVPTFLQYDSDINKLMEE